MLQTPPATGSEETAQLQTGIPEEGPEFFAVGAASCATCHRDLTRRWRRGAHAGAVDSLPAGQRFSADCTPCHSPLSGIDTGVGCEACHGPGSAYRALAVMIDPLKRRAAGLLDAAARCSACHNPDHPFHRERDLAAEAARIHAPRPAPGDSSPHG